MEISRERALEIIEDYLHRLTNEELEDVLYPFGDFWWSPVYGHNFRIVDEGPPPSSEVEPSETLS